MSALGIVTFSADRRSRKNRLLRHRGDRQKTIKCDLSEPRVLPTRLAGSYDGYPARSRCSRSQHWAAGVQERVIQWCDPCNAGPAARLRYMFGSLRVPYCTFVHVLPAQNRLQSSMASGERPDVRQTGMGIARCTRWNVRQVCGINRVGRSSFDTPIVRWSWTGGAFP